MEASVCRKRLDAKPLVDMYQINFISFGQFYHFNDLMLQPAPVWPLTK